MNPNKKSGPNRCLGLTSLIIWIIFGFSASSAAPINSKLGAMTYLKRFGWLDSKANNLSPASLYKMRNSLMEFQKFVGLNPTGELDDETIEIMNTPRCGNRDKIGNANLRNKRYALQGSRWKKRELTYNISNYPIGLSKSDVDDDIEIAFKIWKDATNLSFKKQKSGKVDIDIRFVRGEHDDGDSFDGEDGTLAHAFFPNYGGDVHFDADEIWTLRSDRGTNLLQVATHEFGHSLGLLHSKIKRAVMTPYFYHRSDFKLNSDDIIAIQELYGEKQTDVRTGTSRPNFINPPPPADICRGPKIDAITVMTDGYTYAFKGADVYRLTDTSIAPGYPRKIKSEFGELPSNLDAAFTLKNDKTYFFKGSQFWRLTALTLDSGYPKMISDGFPGIPSNVDAAFLWNKNEKLYFFKGNQVWAFDPDRWSTSVNSPKPISHWKGLPNNLDAALAYPNGKSYFFKGDKYWRFNDEKFAVDSGYPPFPRSISSWWFGCDSSMKKMQDTDENDYENDY